MQVNEHVYVICGTIHAEQLAFAFREQFVYVIIYDAAVLKWYCMKSLVSIDDYVK